MSRSTPNLRVAAVLRAHLEGKLCLRNPERKACPETGPEIRRAGRPHKVRPKSASQGSDTEENWCPEPAGLGSASPSAAAWHPLFWANSERLKADSGQFWGDPRAGLAAPLFPTRHTDPQENLPAGPPDTHTHTSSPETRLKANLQSATTKTTQFQHQTYIKLR